MIDCRRKIYGEGFQGCNPSICGDDCCCQHKIHKGRGEVMIEAADVRPHLLPLLSAVDVVP